MRTGVQPTFCGPLVDDPYINVITVFLSIALYNVLELVVGILDTFKRWKGLYFWSLCLATLGVALNATGYILMHRHLTDNSWLMLVMVLVGWAVMVNGQSVVLYSRLHLLLHDGKRMRAVLWMIIIDGVTMVLSISVLVVGMMAASKAGDHATAASFGSVYKIFEKLQLTVFWLQETIISGVYVWETIKLMRLEQHVRDRAKVCRLRKRLIYINIVVLLLDITTPLLQFSDCFLLQTSYKPLAYSIKLKLEFTALNQLVGLAQRSPHTAAFVINNDILADSSISGGPTDSGDTPARRLHQNRVSSGAAGQGPRPPSRPSIIGSNPDRGSSATIGSLPRAASDPAVANAMTIITEGKDPER